MKSLCHWLNANKISLNTSKTEYVIFKSPQKRLNYDFRRSINGKRLLASKCIRYLGILLDSDLSWKSQINATAVKLKRTNGALAKLCHFVPLHVLMLVYYAISQSHLQYCCQIWGQPNTMYIQRISVLKNCAMRLMSSKLPRESASSLYADVNVLKLSDLIHLHNIILIKNLSLNRMPDSIQDTHSVDLTHDNDFNDFFQIPDVRTVSFGKNSIRYNSLLSWNEIQSLLLSTNLVDLQDLKTGLKECFLATY